MTKRACLHDPQESSHRHKATPFEVAWETMRTYTTQSQEKPGCNDASGRRNGTWVRANLHGTRRFIVSFIRRGIGVEVSRPNVHQTIIRKVYCMSFQSFMHRHLLKAWYMMGILSLEQDLHLVLEQFRISKAPAQVVFLNFMF